MTPPTAGEIEALAVAALLDAGAVRPCRVHPDCLVHQGDADADTTAARIAADRLREAHPRADARIAMGAVQDLVRSIPDECVVCGD